MTNLRRTAALCACFCLIAGICLADSFSDGRSLYKLGDYSGAAAKLEQATRENPKNAEAWWQLNFAYNKLKRYADALQAVNKAGQLDPTHGFASDPSKYQETLNRLQSLLGASSPVSSGSSSSSSRRTSSRGTGGGDIAAQLMKDDVYVQSGIQVDVERLRQVAADLRPQALVKFVIFNSKSNSSRLSAEADRIRKYLDPAIQIGDGYVIAASRSAVAVSSRALNKSKLKALTAQVAPKMEAEDYTGGLELLARGLVQTQQVQAKNTKMSLVLILGLIAGVVVLIVVLKSAAKARVVAARRTPLEHLKSEIISDLNYLDTSMSLVSGGDAARVRQLRVSAGSRLDEAARLLPRAKTETDMNRVQSLLDQAQTDTSNGRLVIDRGIGGGTSDATQPLSNTAAGVSPIAQATAEQTNWSSIPQNEKGVCFFCSRPSLMNELSPVTVNLNNQNQKVLACADDLNTIRTGQMPQIRAFNQGGQYVPWYAAQNYDPYNDYYSRGYNSRDFMGDMITLSVIDSMFWNWQHPQGWGWGGGYGGYGGGYAFYADHNYYRDYNHEQAAGYGDFNQPADAAGTDFLQSTGGDIS